MPAKSNWTVRVKATVDKELVLENCTEDQARADPYSHCVNEIETAQDDYEVIDVEENE